MNIRIGRSDPDPTSGIPPLRLSQPMLELCAVGGCGSAAPHMVLIPHRLGGHEVELETPLCDYHLGWEEAVLDG